MNRTQNPVAWALLGCMLSACGGGGGSGESPPVIAPPPPQPANSAPQATNFSIRTNEGQPASGSLPATDPDNDTLSFAIVAEPQMGLVSITNVTTGAFVYTPSIGEYGTDTFTFSANDGAVTSNVGTVSVVINRIPLATDVSKTIGSTDSTPWEGMLDGVDPDGDPVTFRFINGPSKGVLTSTDTATGAFTYQLNSGQSGTDSFQFEVSDGSATSETARVTININEPPLARNGTLNAMRGESIGGTLEATDSENDTVTFMLETPPSQGAANITDERTGSFTYLPNVDAGSTDRFTFVVTDAYSTSRPGTIDITIYETPTVRFDTDASYAVENKTKSIPLSLSNAIPFDVQVQIEISGTATAVEDYEILTENPFTIPALSLGESFDIEIKSDASIEDEWITLEMMSAVRADIEPTANQHRLTLDDWQGTVSMASLLISWPNGPGLTVDTAGNIYIASRIWVSNEKRSDALVRKLDYRGVEQWTTTFSGPQEGSGNSTDDEYATGVKIDSAGNVYVAGTEGYSNNIRGFLVKLDQDGNKLWHKTISGQSGGIDIRAMDIDASNNILVVGRTSGGVNGEPYLGGTDALLIKFDPDGNEIWTRLFGTTGFEIAEGVAAGSEGQVYVGIRGRGAFGVTAPANVNDIFLTRFASDGTPEWTQSFGSAGEDGLAQLAVDLADNVFLTGDGYLAKFDKDGVEQWIRMFGAGGAEESYGVAVDSTGNAYVTGSWGLSSFNGKFDGNGQLIWLETPDVVGTLQPSGTILRSRRGWAIVEDSLGHFFVLGEGRDGSANYLMKIDTDGAIFD